MTEEGFWTRGEGRLIRWRARQVRARWIELPGEPIQKSKRSGQEKEQRLKDFNAGLGQLRELGQGMLRAPVALDLDFRPASDTHPQIHHLAKRYLDVLGEAPDGTQTEGKRLLYRDDSQVRLLHVRVWDTDNDRGALAGQTMVQARPLRDVVDDLELAHTLRDIADEDSSVFSIPVFPDLDHEPVFDLRHADGEAQAREWDNLNSWFRLDDQARAQEALLDTTDVFLAAQLCRSPRVISGAATPPSTGHATLDAPTVKAAAVGRDTLLAHPLQIALPPLPTTAGEGKTFTADLRERLAAWQRRLLTFDQLQVPVKAILLVVLPKKLERQRVTTGKGADLDNIAKKVLPVVHEVLAPRPEPWVNRFQYLPQDLQDKRRGRYDRLLKLNKRSVAAYEIVEISRAPGDPDEGVVRLVFGNATLPGSTWSRVADFATRAIDRTHP